MSPTLIQIVGTALFALAVLHTFSTKAFERLAHSRPQHAGMFHLLGEVEVVFGFWAMVLMAAMLLIEGKAAAIAYIDSRNFTEPMFVFAIMVIAGSRPITALTMRLTTALARLLPLPGQTGFVLVCLTLLPLMGSLITEPAAMTLAALLLRQQLYGRDGPARISTRLRYAGLGVLFVNVSIGGVLTPYAAPPVLMVAGTWGWDLSYMLTHFGGKAALAVAVNGTLLVALFWGELSRLSAANQVSSEEDSALPTVPLPVSLIHVGLLASVVIFAHHPPIFMGALLFFLGYAQAYTRHHDERLILREGLLVAFFLAGLVVLGGQQQWWLEALMQGMNETSVYYGATALTAITDNAALTYLGSLVPGLSEGFKVALVAGAVTGGGLTVIANAPNPAGFAILRDRFTDGAIHPLGLFLAATPPTLIAILAFRAL
jgi:hypothetical protein